MSRDETLRLLRERILAFAASRIGKDAAEDLAQEVLMLLHGKYAKVSELSELLPLSIRIMRFKIAGLRRKISRRGEVGVPVDELNLAEPQSLTTHLERKEMGERLEAALRKMGSRCRDIFRMKLLGKTFAEIQAELGAASINTVYTWDARCRKRLLELMGGGWEKSS